MLENLYQPLQECRVDILIPGIDIIFPPLSILEERTTLDIAPISENISSFPSIETFEFPYLPEFLVVSNNLLESLSSSRVDGKAYGEEKENLQGELLPLEHYRPKGLRKAFTEVKRGSTTERRTLSVWDLILPLLQPPLRHEFPKVLDLPHDVFPYQWEGIKFLVENKCALLGDKMGLGKTVQAVLALRCLFQRGGIKSALIVCPLSVFMHWDDELGKWAPSLSVTCVRGSKEYREKCWEHPAHVWLTNYDTLRQDMDIVEKFRGKNGYDIIIADEVQKIKSPGTGYAKALKQLSCHIRWGLSGTPLENKLEDLAGVFSFVKPGLFKSSKNLSAEATKKLIKPFLLRRRIEDVLRDLPDLPDKKEDEAWVSLDIESKQYQAYKLAEGKGVVYLKSLKEKVTVQHILALLTKLKQICNVDHESGESSKLEWIKNSLEDIVPSGDKALIYSQFLESGVDWLESQLKEFNPLILKGGQSDNERCRVLQLFGNEDRHSILLVSLRAGALGLNLIKANYVFLFDHWWNPAIEAQAGARVHRIGQEKDVFVYNLWVKDTVEERIYVILEKKKKLFADVIDSLSNVEGSGLSEEELFGLFGLEKPQKVVTHKQDLLSLSPRDFENVVEKLFQKMGYGTRRMPTTRDKGVDIIATRHGISGVEKIAIQCKRYEGSVGEPIARELLGVVAADSEWTKGIIVASSNFTTDCVKFCERQGQLELINGTKLRQLLEHYNVMFCLGQEISHNLLVAYKLPPIGYFAKRYPFLYHVDFFLG